MATNKKAALLGPDAVGTYISAFNVAPFNVPVVGPTVAAGFKDWDGDTVVLDLTPKKGGTG